jgi:hypothetical protein
LPLWTWDDDPLEVLPGMRKWSGRGEQAKFRRTATATRIFVAPDLRRDPDERIDTLHAVTTCDLAAAELDCASMGVLGPASRSFYVSSSAVYLWVGDAWADDRPRGGSPSQIYRLPLREGRPAAVGVRGGPIDQFSFREDARKGVLNVVVRSEGAGDAMWRSEFSEGALALVRIPIRRFGDGSSDVAASRYRWLPFPKDGGRVTNRFVGDYLLYGESLGWFAAGDDSVGGRLWAASLEGGAITALRSPQAVDRIEITGRDALVIGPGRRGDLVFQTVELTGGAAPVLGDRYSYKDASEGETRSHAFFYKPQADAPFGDSGLLALPVARAARPAYRQLFESSAAMVYLRRSDRRLSPLGDLAAGAEGFVDDACKASCTDWYGNARPIFLGGRAFALLGYELVEGKVGEQSISEIGRVNFAPGPPREKQ